MGVERKMHGHHRRREARSRLITKPATRWSRLMVPNADPVHKVTIIPRGMALGVTQQLPDRRPPQLQRRNTSKARLRS